MLNLLALTSDPLLCDPCHFEGDTILYFEEGDPTARIEVTPDEQGRYPLGAGSWDWFLSVRTDPDGDAAQLADAGRLYPQDGEILVTQGMPGRDPVFPAIPQPGFHQIQRLVPLFRREVAEVVVAWTNDVYRRHPHGSVRAHWIGDEIEVLSAIDCHREWHSYDWICADKNGRYSIASCWVWTRLD
ncbi:hypothetical protein [Kutzneria sp. 744]|uniref:hypothetical protein n=1 Tax=Kutzneria sp. (strain 744) TaxID=345341 RepID=UPI0003EEBDC3|nr:hypothetical protein [Kutzneria sp. 744]EWM19634.1 hypothetical protein KUTG_09938 [Kutzneria sp. 744]